VAYDALQEGAKNVSREVCVGAKGCFVYKRLWLGWRYGPPFTSHWPCGPAMPCMRFSGFEMGFMCARREREKARAAVTWAALFHSPLAMATDRGPKICPLLEPCERL